MRNEPDFGRQVDALLWALNAPGNEAVRIALDAAKTGADATRDFFSFERAGAADADLRRIAIAPEMEVAVARMFAPDP